LEFDWSLVLLSLRLYSTCERKKWAEEAVASNSLDIAGPHVAGLALRARQGEPFG